jgi:hypothetical protein
MLVRKLLVAVAAGALITTFSIASTPPAFAAKAKRAKHAKVVRAPAPTVGTCVAGALFLPVKLLIKQPIC